MKKYKYDLLNIYSGKWFTLETDVFYEKHTFLNGVGYTNENWRN